MPVHYAGVACEMDAIMAIAERHDLAIVEDAAQGIMAGYKGRALGAIGDLGSFSFHETKNIISGEGGALLVRRSSDSSQRAEIIREKGTDRGRFFRGEVDKYTWQDVGSSFLPSEIIAAFLWAQLEEAERITRERLAIWHRYHACSRRSSSRACCAGRSCQRIASTTATCTTSCWRRIDRQGAGRAQDEGIAAVSTMSRCIPRRRASASDARMAILR